MTKSATNSFAPDYKQDVSSRGLLSMFRNKLINGNFDVWQRGTSHSATSVISSYGSDDRWTLGTVGTTIANSRQAFTLGQTDVPGNPTYFSRLTVTSVANSANYAVKSQKIEGVNNFAGGTATLTFWAKADAGRNIATEFIQTYGSGGTAEQTGLGVTTFTLSTTWQKFSVVVNLPSLAGKTLGTSDLLALLFWFDAGSSFNSRTNSLGQQSGTFDIARVSIVEGDATAETDPFSPRPIGIETVLCQRYYQVASTATGATGASGQTGQIASTMLPVAMRATPTVTRLGNHPATTAAGTGGASATVLWATNSNITGGTFGLDAEL